MNRPELGEVTVTDPVRRGTYLRALAVSSCAKSSELTRSKAKFLDFHDFERGIKLGYWRADPGPGEVSQLTPSVLKLFALSKGFGRSGERPEVITVAKTKRPD
jgi:hypothetical protein